MRVGWDDYARVYLNGKNVFTSGSTAFTADAVTISDLKLKRGRNVLLLEVANGIGPWRGSIRFTDVSGHPIAGIKATWNPQNSVLP